MRAVRVTAAAEEDLRKIWAYVAEHNAEAASKLIKEITNSSLC
jgi:plasmid stabilization system protein ParE